MILSLKNFTLSTPDGRILKDSISVELDHHEALLVTGPNGSGKTTLLNYLAPILAPFAPLEYVPQLANVHSFLPMTILELIKLSYPHHSCEQILELGLLGKEHLSRAWATASGGERKRALFTKLLLGNPKLIILDEPFNHLDQQVINHFLSLLAERLKKQELVSLVMVAHQELSYSHFAQAGIPLKRIAL
jgi:zinc transport system ATP-binding protein